MKSFDLLCSFTIDTIVRKRNRIVAPGGPALYSTLAILLTKRPRNATVYSVVGYDFREKWLKRLERLGADLSNVVRDPSRATTKFTLRLSGDDRTLYVKDPLDMDAYFSSIRPQSQSLFVSFTYNEVRPSTIYELTRNRVCLVDLQGFARKAASTGQVTKKRLMFDFSNFRFVKFSKSEVTSPKAIVERALSQGVEEVLVTDGGRGSVLYTEDQIYKCLPKFDAQGSRNFDSTGAGDVFGAEYFASRIEGESPKDALLRATSAAAIKSLFGSGFMTVSSDTFNSALRVLSREVRCTIDS